MDHSTNKRPATPDNWELPRNVRPRLPDRISVASGSGGMPRARQALTDIVARVGSITGASAQDNQYKYSPLQPGEFRLLNLVAGDPGDSIVCELHTLKFVQAFALPERERYEALSYSWGIGDATETISIRDRPPLGPTGNRFQQAAERIKTRQEFRVTKTLKQILRQLRATDLPTVLWVDAICINQKDQVERSQQVAKMADIFRNASLVRIWLGPGDETSTAALAFIEEMLNLPLLDDLISGNGADPSRWYNLIKLMRNKWFTRRWVVQELGLARLAVLHVGDKMIFWDYFAEAVAVFKQENTRIADLFKASQDYKLNDSILGDVQSSGAYSIVHTTNNLFRRIGTHMEPTMRLEELVSQLLFFDSKDPRDIGKCSFLISCTHTAFMFHCLVALVNID
jgi:hypothetical protein